VLFNVFAKVVPNSLKRNYFSEWNKSANMMRRFEMASILLK